MQLIDRRNSDAYRELRSHAAYLMLKWLSF